MLVALTFIVFQNKLSFIFAIQCNAVAVPFCVKLGRCILQQFASFGFTEIYFIHMKHINCFRKYGLLYYSTLLKEPTQCVTIPVTLQTSHDAAWPHFHCYCLITIVPDMTARPRQEMIHNSGYFGNYLIYFHLYQVHQLFLITILLMVNYQNQVCIILHDDLQSYQTTLQFIIYDPRSLWAVL